MFFFNYVYCKSWIGKSKHWIYVAISFNELHVVVNDLISLAIPEERKTSNPPLVSCPVEYSSWFVSILCSHWKTVQRKSLFSFSACSDISNCLNKDNHCRLLGRCGQIFFVAVRYFPIPCDSKTVYQITQKALLSQIQLYRSVLFRKKKVLIFSTSELLRFAIGVKCRQKGTSVRAGVEEVMWLTLPVVPHPGWGGQNPGAILWLPTPRRRGFQRFCAHHKSLTCSYRFISGLLSKLNEHIKLLRPVSRTLLGAI